MIRFCLFTLLLGFSSQIYSQDTNSAQDSAVVLPAQSGDSLLDSDSSDHPQDSLVQAVKADLSHNPQDSLDQTVATDSSDHVENSLNQAVTLSIKTEPEEAAVILDDSLRGLSPVTISDIDTGRHILVLKKKGFYLKKVEFRIDSGGSKELSIVLQQPGQLHLISEPSGARLSINKDSAGVTPYIDSLCKPGKYQIRAEMKNYEPFDSSVIVNSGESKSVKIELSHTAVYLDSLKEIRDRSQRSRKRFTSILVLATFAAFGVIMFLMESADR